MKKCPNCHFEFSEEFNFCPKCGNKYSDFQQTINNGINYGRNGQSNNNVINPISSNQFNNNGLNSVRNNQLNNRINYGRSNEQSHTNQPPYVNSVGENQYHNSKSSKHKSNGLKTVLITLGVLLGIWILVPKLDDNKSTDQDKTTSIDYKTENDVTRDIKESESSSTSYSSSATNKNSYPTIPTGVYVVGEDINEGTYYFHVISGLGELLLYNNYDEYKADDSGFDSIASFDLKAADASSGLTNEDVYAEYVSGIILEDGQCLVIKRGAVVEYVNSMDEYGLSGVVTPGIYVVGQNLDSGKYNFNAVSGMGEVCIYSSYDSFKESSSSFYADENYDLKAPDASVGLTNEAIYSNSINNIRLTDGQCLYVGKGLTLSYNDDNSVKNNIGASEVNQPETDTKEVPPNDEKEAETKDHDNNSGDSTGYEAIYDEYVKKIKDATPGLIQEYKDEAANNNNGLEGLAEISNKKIEKLAGIANEGVEEMASYMMKKGSGNYDEYSDWSGKLYDVYLEEAGKITDEYMNSALH